MKRQGERVPGIGHRIKSKDNRDARVALLQAYARKFFPATRYLDYAVQVSEGEEREGEEREGERGESQKGGGRFFLFSLSRSLSLSLSFLARTTLTREKKTGKKTFFKKLPQVEEYTLTKAANLLLNVDGCIGALFLDLLWSCGMFSEVSWRKSLFFSFFSMYKFEEKARAKKRFPLSKLSQKGKREREREKVSVSRPPFPFFLGASFAPFLLLS